MYHSPIFLTTIKIDSAKLRKVVIIQPGLMIDDYDKILPYDFKLLPKTLIPVQERLNA
jgi:hypothetical protein